jgi:hypothetical protein
MRSLSTFSFRDIQTNPKSVPFPQLPTIREVQSAKKDADGEIQRIKADLSSLQHQRNAIDSNVADGLVPQGSAHGAHEYRSMIISQSIVDSVISANGQKKRNPFWNLLFHSRRHLVNS